jgi:hypothetical protein
MPSVGEMRTIVGWGENGRSNGEKGRWAHWGGLLGWMGEKEVGSTSAGRARKGVK